MAASSFRVAFDKLRAGLRLRFGRRGERTSAQNDKSKAGPLRLRSVAKHRRFQYKQTAGPSTRARPTRGGSEEERRALARDDNSSFSSPWVGRRPVDAQGRPSARTTTQPGQNRRPSGIRPTSGPG